MISVCTMAVTLGVLGVGAVGPLTHVQSLTEPLDSPARLAVSATGLLVTDPRHDAIVRFDPAGVYIGTWSEPAGPLGVAVHPDGRILVSRRDDARVGVYDSAFTFLRYLGDGNPMVTFVRPTDLAVDATTGRIYVVDSGGDRVYGFAADESLALILGARGGLNSQFKYPAAIAVDSARGRILVADQDNFRVQVFSTSGLFQFKFGYRIKFLPGGTSEGWFARAAGLAVDAQGNIYVTDGLMSTLRVFNASGVELSKLLDYGVGPGHLQTPAGVAVDASGRILLANSNAGSVDIYAAPARAVLTAPAAKRTTGMNLSETDRRLALLLQPTALFEVGESPSAGQADEAALTTYEPPHALSDVICGRCHDVDAQPGGHLGLAAGQTNLCLSCHTTGGHAVLTAFRAADAADPYGTNPAAADQRGTSHAWGVAAVNAAADSVGPTAGGEMARYLDGGNIKCATCHNQHNNSAGTPFLRVSNTRDVMCKECHAPRNRGPGQGGSHAVGFAYPSNSGEYPDGSSNGLPPLPGGRVECTTCHGVHGADSGGAHAGAGDGMLLRGSNDGTPCRTCHTEHIGHTPSGAWQPTCTDCHDVHDPANANLALVDASVFNQTLGVTKPVIFTARTGAGSFADGDPAQVNGICEVCHTATAYHKQDGTGAAHNGGQDCVTCHPHAAGFMPTGGDCLSCHGVAQDNGDNIPPGGRRAVVGEFPAGDAHAHVGVTLDNGTCGVCHDMATHMDGYVDLLDPDTASLYRFQKPGDLTADPDVSDFCAHCHDADGAARLPVPGDPFGSGHLPPNVATKFLGTLQWLERYGDVCYGEEGTLRPVNSHHDISDGDQTFSGAKLECLNCHGAHGSGASQPLADPYAPTTPWAGTANDFCLACHAGGAGPADPGLPPGVSGPIVALRGLDSCAYQDPMWYVDYTWTHSAHGADSKRAWSGYSGAPAATLECTVCHDPHGSYTPTNLAGNPYLIRDIVDGTAYVDDGVRPGPQWTGPPWNTFGTAREVKIAASGATVDWGGSTGLCNVCHATWLNAYGFHEVCTGCQTCHGHGQLWGEHDWGGGANDSTACPPGLRAAEPAGIPARSDSTMQQPAAEEPPIHLRAFPPAAAVDR